MEAELRVRTGHALLIRVSQVGERFGAHSVMRGTPNIPYVVCCRRVVCVRRASGEQGVSLGERLGVHV